MHVVDRRELLGTPGGLKQNRARRARPFHQKFYVIPGGAGVFGGGYVDVGALGAGTAGPGAIGPGGVP